jgi:predicted amidophosphoribosyltransferase
MAEGAGAVDALVPVPRAPLRRWRTGVDPARQLAAALGRIVGLPVVDALAAPLWWPRHAGRPRAERASIRFRAKCPVFGAVAIIDDVVTTGRTLESAASAVAGMPSLALVATSAGSMSVG